MIVVAGPPGSGKSSVFPVAQTGVDCFNIDDRSAELNGGAYQNISPEIRSQANHECEEFIAAHIRDGTSFAVETTLRGQKALDNKRQTVADVTDHGESVRCCSSLEPVSVSLRQMQLSSS